MALVRFIKRLQFWKRPALGVEHNSDDQNSSQCILSTLQHYEKLISTLEDIIMWKDPVVSVLFIVFVNLLFGVLATCEWRVFGLLSAIILVCVTLDLWSGLINMWEPATEAETPGPASPRVEAASKRLTSIYSNVKEISNFRRQKPGFFCCGVALVCSSLFMLAGSVSGIMLVYILVMAVLLVPGLIINCIPPELKLIIARNLACANQVITSCARNDDSDDSDDEYMLHITREDLDYLIMVNDLEQEPYDSLTNPGSSSDMVSGLGMMPSHEEDSLASDLEHGLSLPLDHLEDSDSNPDDNQMQFQSGHFNGDSYSDEDSCSDEHFAKDLLFSESDVRDSPVAKGISTLITQAVTRNLANNLGLLTEVFRPQQTTVEKSEREIDSDLDDYDVISKDELNT